MQKKIINFSLARFAFGLSTILGTFSGFCLGIFLFKFIWSCLFKENSSYFLIMLLISAILNVFLSVFFYFIFLVLFNFIACYPLQSNSINTRQNVEKFFNRVFVFFLILVLILSLMTLFNTSLEISLFEIIKTDIFELVLYSIVTFFFMRVFVKKEMITKDYLKFVTVVIKSGLSSIITLTGLYTIGMLISVSPIDYIKLFFTPLSACWVFLIDIWSYVHGEIRGNIKK